jgi:hypothetical protein
MAESKDPVTLEQDVDRTRAAMDRTIDAIAGKLTPQQLMLEALGLFKDGSSTAATKLVETAREHPFPAALIGLGLALMFNESRSGPDGSPAGRTVDTLRDRADDLKTVAGHGLDRVADKAATTAAAVAERAERVGQAVHDKVDGVKERASHAAADLGERAAGRRGKATQAADGVRERVAEVPGAARSQLHDAQLGFWQFMDQRPLAVGAAALAAGLAAGLAMPETECENRMMGEKRDQLLDQARSAAKDVGGQVVDKGRQVARTAVEVAREEAERQGLKPSELAQKVQAVVSRTGETLRSEARNAVPAPLKSDL